MSKALRNGGILLLVFVFLVLETFVSAFPQIAPLHPPLQGRAVKWVSWGAWGWLLLQILLSVWPRRRNQAQWRCTCAFSLTWALALLPLTLGALVVMLTGSIRQGSALAWISLPWAGLLVWQSIRGVES